MLKHRFTLFLLLISITLSTAGFSCKLFPASQPPASLTASTNLEYWGVWDQPEDLQPIINDFKALHPNINITYKKFRLAEYKQKLLEAWAIDQGPDLYSIPAAWLKEYQDKITPQPDIVQLAFKQVTKNAVGQTQETTIVQSVPIFKPSDIKTQFAEAIFKDVVIDNKVYGLPLSLDTLALFYNRDLLDAAGIATPPTTWTELAQDVKKLTTFDQKNSLLTSGVALGTGNNITNSADILSLIMMQVGTPMTAENGQTSFASADINNTQRIPALDALRFYTDFANPIKEVYSWNSKQSNSLDAFIAGRLGMLFTYDYNLPAIKGRAPKLNLGISNMVQLEGAQKPVNFSNYWVETVSHKAKNPVIAWGFLNFAAGKDEVQKYLDKTKKPTALRSLITGQLNDPELSVFASQVLTAQRWYRGKDANKMEELMNQLITDYPESLRPEQLLRQTVEKINQTL